ncbi:MAG: thioredoxin-disulfide reductase [Caldilineae bacterium]|nr:MAG: thioredoxin-disulfide reductase [Caldilineae bacterium]
MTIENVIIIGSGPAGFTAGLYTARAQLNPLLITGNEIGGQVALTHEIENYPGFPEGLPGPELVERFQKQAERFGTRIEYDYVNEVDFHRHPFIVRTQSGKEYQARSVIVSTGATPRKLQVPGEEELTGRGVSYCGTCDGFFFRGKEVVVVGGGDSAIEEGIFLTRFATKVTVIHRRDELRASKILQKRAFENEKMDFIWDTVVESINAGENNAVASVTLRNVKTGEIREFPTDGVFIFIGHVPNSQIFEGQLEMKDGYVVTNKYMHTSVPGVFAAGEIQDNRFRQVASSVGQGTMAAMEAEKFLAELEDKGYEQVRAEMLGLELAGA